MASLHEPLVGVKGLAILRTLYDDNGDARGDRMREVHDLLTAGTDESSSASLGVEYGLQDG